MVLLYVKNVIKKPITMDTKNRTIKFRAKRKRDGVWVYGLENPEKSNELTLGQFWNQVADGLLDKITVMQYTGLKDLNGIEIYEGDILGENTNEEKWKSGESERIVVEYDNDLTRFLCIFYTVFGGEGYSGRTKEQQLCEYILNEWYVIGNEFENKELLK